MIKWVRQASRVGLEAKSGFWGAGEAGQAGSGEVALSRVMARA